MKSVTTIEHDFRAQLGITCLDYVVLDGLIKMREDATFSKETYSSEMVQNHISSTYRLSLEDVMCCMNKLYAMGYIKKDHANGLYVNKGIFAEKDGKYKSEFDEIWKTMVINNMKIRWTGTYEMSFNAYKKVRQSYDFQYLLRQKEAYFQMLSKNPYRAIMMCASFFSMKTKRFTEDFGLSTDGKELIPGQVPSQELFQ